MPARQSEPQRKTVSRVMHEFKHGELEKADGAKVKSRKQAVAIALNEAGSSRGQSPKQKAHRLSRTKAKEATGRTAQAEKEGKAAQDRTMKAAERKTVPHGSRAKGAQKAAATRMAHAKREPTRAELYAQARKRGIEGRSGMTKEQLQRALHH